MTPNQTKLRIGLTGRLVLGAVLLTLGSCSEALEDSADHGFQSREPSDGGLVGDGGRDANQPSDLGQDAALDECRTSDSDGDGFGTSPTCERIDCDDENPSIHPASFEACNGLDDDCDDRIDEDLGEVVCGEGACMVSAQNCVDGETAVCIPRMPEHETCNAVDDDCDGNTDEEVDSVRCGIGACEQSAECVGGQLEECVPGEPVRESCNGVDDDCDGVVDNGFRARVIPSTYSVLANHHPACDGSGQRIGTACNAAMNRFCRAQDCGSTGFGPAENSGDVAHVTCINGAEPHVVTFDTLWRHHEECESSDVAFSGSCNAAIHRYCQSRGQVTGFGPVEVGPNDMNAVCLQEAVEVLDTQYSVVSQHHPPCDGTNQTFGADCNAAIKRWCISQGFVSGFGPVEHNGDALSVACLRD